MGYFVTVEPGVRIYVEDVNPEGNKTILFIHGWPLNHKQYEYQFNVLPAMGYRCIGIDWRGFGNSDKPFTGYNYDRLADDIHAVIGTFQLKTSHSWDTLQVEQSRFDIWPDMKVMEYPNLSL